MVLENRNPQGWKKNFDGKKKWENNNADHQGKWKKKPIHAGEHFVDVPLPKSGGRSYTVSMAVPASILEETCLKDELRTYVIGQLARAANIYSIDEIIVYDDGCWRKNDVQSHMEMMHMLLEYQECPQYLRKHMFPYHKYLSHVGVLNALNAPHHLRANQWCLYREGVVSEKSLKTQSLVDAGLQTELTIEQKLQPGLRVTLKMPPEAKEMRKPYATVVSPDEPKVKHGFYWGYSVRSADSLSKVFTECRFKEGYDLLIGTSDKGDDVAETEFPEFEHALVVFGGVEGLEAALEADTDLEATKPEHLFDYYVNTCPLQQARTIRTEEAVLISLCSLQYKLIPKTT
ncbi:unnamed protein product [Meganyctiphanes norvegica]|uniref:RNA methyltransferase n=1 Tax=Meganyctiphanes norvegica TaxID=48144 RepID=A0AAV2RWY7_MEGNR